MQEHLSSGVPAWRAVRPLALVAATLACQTTTTATPGESTEALGACADCSVIRHVCVVDANGMRGDRRVSLRAGRIHAEEPDQEGPAASGEVDGTGQCVLPGLWDMHLHLLMSAAYSGLPSVYLPEHLNALLLNGVTGGLDLGGHTDTLFAMQDALAGQAALPDVEIAGPFVTAPGSHPCNTAYIFGYCILIDSPAAAAPAVAALAARGPDVLKLVIESGHAGAPQPRITPEAARAVVVAAASHDLPVVAHVSNLDDVVEALDVEVSALAHPPLDALLTDELLNRIAERKLPVISSLAVLDALSRYEESPAAYLDDPHVVAAVTPPVLDQLRSVAFQSYMRSAGGVELVGRFRAALGVATENVRRLHERGVPIYAGTDAGMLLTFHGPSLHRELELLTGVGLTPIEAITAATLGPAQFLHLDQEIGRVAPGYRADLVMVRGEVFRDISKIREISAVWRNGIRVEGNTDLSARLLTTPPAAPPVPPTDGPSPYTLCQSDLDCAAGTGCDRASFLCRSRCELGLPDSCPPNYGCVARADGAYCFASEGCDPLAQDCPSKGVYGTTCIPVESDYTICFSPGPRLEGEACDWSTNTCATGMVCAQDRCVRLCDPSTNRLPACTTNACIDGSSDWGWPVGLCL